MEAVLTAHRVQTDYCFKSQPPPFWGSVDLSWRVDQLGQAVDVEAKRGTAPPMVVTCLIDRLKRMRFASTEQRLAASFFTANLDPDIIRQIVRGHSGQINSCYEQELVRTPGIAGKVVMKWIINSEGIVTRAEAIESKLNSPAVESCLANGIMTWTFPKPKGGGIVMVNYPFVFRPGPPPPVTPPPP
jgi:hypothetical protein